MWANNLTNINVGGSCGFDDVDADEEMDKSEADIFVSKANFLIREVNILVSKASKLPARARNLGARRALKF